MSDTRGGERPRQATVAGWLIMLGSVFVVVSVFEQIGGIHTLETREAAERLVSEPPGSGLGLDVDSVLTLMRVLAMVAGACATATAILGYQVLQRVRSARLALSVLAVPLFLSGMVTGGFLSSVVAAASVMLWLQPTRDWLDGVKRPAPRPADQQSEPRHEPASFPEPSRDRPADPAHQAPPPVATEPRAYPGFGAPASTPTGQDAPAGSPYPQAAPWGPGPGQPVAAGAGQQRPAAVVWACLLTWGLGGLAVLMLLASMVALLAAPDALFDQLYQENPELAEEGIPRSTLTAVTLFVAGMAALWAAAATVVAVFVWRGAPWARLVLAVSAAAAAAVFLIGSAASLVLLVPLLGAAATVFLLLRPEVRAWFAARGPRRP